MTFDVIAVMIISFGCVYFLATITNVDLANPMYMFFDYCAVIVLIGLFYITWPIIAFASYLLDNGDHRK